MPEFLNVAFLILIAILSWWAALHALLYKRDPRAALGWIAVSLVFPFFGPLLYYLFGINRVRTKGLELGRRLTLNLRFGFERAETHLEELIPPSEVPEQYLPIARLSDAVTNRPLLPGNVIEPLQNGEETFPAMIEAIEAAGQRVYLTTYILETNRTGRQIIKSLGRAADRGVDVRVIVDGVGELYSWPRARTLLRRTNVQWAIFLPPRLIPPSLHINLRNHRKLLIVDGRIGFTGGMNIGDRNLAADLSNPARVEDLHFRVHGPVLAQMEQVFLADWSFCSGSSPPPIEENVELHTGGALCRTLVDGPNEDLDRLAMILVGSVSMARKRVYLMTPYFLPSRELIGALQSAVLRGIDVKIVLPWKNNLPYIKWAGENMLWELLQYGVRVYYQPPPFVHSKLFLVDDYYTVIGSANIDPRSLRLNFEMALEIYDQAFNADLSQRFLQAVSRSRERTLAEVDGRSYPVRIRDSLCWLFSPYL
jgi:cardiolipin synthase A/B